MTNPRLEQLLRFLQEDPNDPFTLYALATEYRSIEQATALAYYEKLLAEHPNYVGTYYHAAKLYAELGQYPKAEETFKKGLLISQQAGERTAYRELQAAYREFLDEQEDL